MIGAIIAVAVVLIAVSLFFKLIKLALILIVVAVLITFFAARNDDASPAMQTPVVEQPSGV